jgi:hypothetical protein
MRALAAAPLLCLALGALAGCGGSGSYALAWHLTPGDAPDAFLCAQRGVNGVQVQAAEADSDVPVDLVIFPCGDGHGTRRLPAGDYSLYVSAVDAQGARVADPQTGLAYPPQVIPVTITASGTVAAGVVLTLPADG